MDKINVEKFHKEICSVEEAYLKNRAQIERKMVNLFLNLIDQVESGKTTIQKASYIMTGFIQYELSDELGSAVEIAGELELPKKYVQGDIDEKWSKVKQILNKIDKTLILESKKEFDKWLAGESKCKYCDNEVFIISQNVSLCAKHYIEKAKSDIGCLRAFLEVKENHSRELIEEVKKQLPELYEEMKAFFEE